MLLIWDAGFTVVRRRGVFSLYHVVQLKLLREKPALAGAFRCLSLAFSFWECNIVCSFCFKIGLNAAQKIFKNSNGRFVIFLTRVNRVTIMVDMIYNTLILKRSSNEELISREKVRDFIFLLVFCTALEFIWRTVLAYIFSHFKITVYELLI